MAFNNTMKNPAPARKLSHDPVRRGKFYCSPSCGYHCTFADFEKAKERATRLARLMGPGWNTHVWENLGWHYSVIISYASIIESRMDGQAQYHANIANRFTAWGNTPRKAFSKALLALDDEIASLNSVRYSVVREGGR